MPALPSERLLTLILLALAIYFSVLVGQALWAYAGFRRLAGTALVSWPARRPRNSLLLMTLGVVSLAVAVLNGMLDRPFHHVYSQGVMAAYFILVVPLLGRIRPGVYRDGVWADSGFLRWERIGRLAFLETPEIVLLLLPRGRQSGPFRLPVPPEEYGAVRKVLEDKIRARQLTMENTILGLSEP